MSKEIKVNGPGNPGIERIVPKYKIVHLDRGMTQEHKNDLRIAVAKQGGLIDVPVHPYYEDNIHRADYSYPASPDYIRARDDFFRKAIPAGQPLLILQDEWGEVEVHTRGIKSGTLYMFGGLDAGLLETFANYRVGDILVDAGVTHIRISGRILMYADDSKWIKELEPLKELCQDRPHAIEWLSRSMLPYGCPMWAAMGFLKRGFDVSFSSIVSPAVLNHP